MTCPNCGTDHHDYSHCPTPPSDPAVLSLQAQLDRIEAKQTQIQDGLLIMIEKHRRIESKLDKLLEDRE